METATDTRAELATEIVTIRLRPSELLELRERFLKSQYLPDRKFSNGKAVQAFIRRQIEL
jgi:hypothetical protein